LIANVYAGIEVGEAGAALSEGAAWEVVDGCYIHRDRRFGRLMLRGMIGGCGVYSSGWNARRDVVFIGKGKGGKKGEGGEKGESDPT
jgi:hypothetical protein